MLGMVNSFGCSQWTVPGALQIASRVKVISSFYFTPFVLHYAMISEEGGYLLSTATDERNEV